MQRREAVELNMTRSVGAALRACLACLALMSPSIGLAAQSSRALSEQLLSENAGERSAALEEVRRLGVGRASQEVRSALIKALQQEAMLHRQRDLADRRGDNLPALDDPELLTRLAGTVGEFAGSCFDSRTRGGTG